MQGVILGNFVDHESLELVAQVLQIGSVHTALNRMM
jgi:hypothetical protein